MKKSKLSRENYLIQATDIMRKSLFKPKGYKVPKVELSISWATSGNKGKHSKTGGQCFAKRLHENNINQIIISPSYSGTTIEGTLRILDILAHELIHAVDDLKSGHGKAFKDCALAIGLKAPVRSTTASDELNEWLRKNIVDKLGKFPHGKVTLSGAKQTTRNIKVECYCCGFSFRTSRKNIDMMDEISHCLACNDGVLQEA